MSPTPSSPAPRSVPRARSGFAAVTAFALVAAVALLAPTTASSLIELPSATVDPIDEPIYANSVATFSGTCPRLAIVADGGDPGLDRRIGGGPGNTATMTLTYAVSDAVQPFQVGVTDGVWSGDSGFLGDTDEESVTVTIDCGSGYTAERTFDLVTPTLDLELTVGTEPGECATTSAIEVDAGTDVYWCYTATNNSGRTYDGHQLADDVDVVILANARFEVGPGEWVDTLTLGVELSDTVTADLSRTGTWELFECDGDSIDFCSLFDAAEASAEVTVLDEPAPPPTTEAGPATTTPGPAPAPAPVPAPAPAPAAQPVVATPTYTG